MFSVRWTLAELAALWVNAAPNERTLLTDAVNEVDRILKQDAAEAGESRDDNLRILFVAPIVLHYRVWESDRIAQVVGLWPFR